MSERVVVAASGGVDSSVAAAILRDQGHEVICVTLQLHDCDEATASRSCCGVDALARARAVAAGLGLRHYLVDARRALDEQVLRPALDDYQRGRTPSPCLRCNEELKFGLVLRFARSLGATRLATGHYARLRRDATGRLALLRSLVPDKDQSYFLAGLGAEILEHLAFPLGDLSKVEVRARAHELGLASAGTPDSQDACLVAPGQSFAQMLLARFGARPRPGAIVDDDGRVVGHHDGLHRFTVGQRQGLGLTTTVRHWVRALDPIAATVRVTSDPGRLDRTGFTVSGMRWFRPPAGPGAREVEIQVRHRHPAQRARVDWEEPARITVAAVAPIRAVTPGQAAVLFDGDEVLGRGWIDDPPDA